MNDSSVTCRHGIRTRASVLHLVNCGCNLQEKSVEGTLVNLMGVLLLLFTGLVTVLVSKASFKRLNRYSRQRVSLQLAICTFYGLTTQKT